MTEYQIFTVDAFASKPFEGNQAGIVPVPADQPLSAETMLQLAAEMAIAETAYLTPLSRNPGSLPFQTESHFNLRWFTPAYEVKLCGHATLAAAHVLFFELNNTSDSLTFDTLSGDLTVSRNADGSLTMRFPQDKPEGVIVDQEYRTIVQATLGHCREDVEVYLSPALNYLVIYDPQMTYQGLRDVAPRFSAEALDARKAKGVMGLVVTSRGKDVDFESRFFDPWSGVDEDPVTGSAHTVLAPFWNERLQKSEFSAYQCSQRGGSLGIELLDNGQVAVSGKGVVVIRGTLRL
ncbi:hypothetical protein LPJ53_005966 [Coemansia erecta]|uniref:Phenazine biosynthesis PhzC/PhzF protein n=1 Tax=Coemansia erecta TaxID=147472 RepID=A0A9W7XV39_9FUNG|nr:hypothetical protein LPJ53_005966 [Coemansia erecta]